MRRIALPILVSGGLLLAVCGAGAAAPIRAVQPSQTRVVPSQALPDARTRLVKLSADPWTNNTSEHKTEVEPDIFASGSTIVGAFQEGRFVDGGSSDVGWATSTDGGTTWQHGALPGITNIQSPGNTYDRDTDPAVVYDAKHGLWLIASLPLVDVTSSAIGQIPLVSASNDGIHWGNPVAVASNNGDFIDKSWITCDNWSTSPNYGHCYVEFDDVYQGDYIYVTTSTDGGKTWSTPYAAGQYGLGGVPQALPNGTAVVPYTDGYSNILAFTSTNGGKTWSNNVEVSPINWHGTSGSVRTEPLPSSTIDGSGRLWVAWQDCSFRAGCAENDIVYSTTTDGVHWTAEQRVPIDAVNSTVDHFEPGITADISTTGSSVHLGLTYYFFPQTNCNLSTCQLEVGFVGSQDSGQTWSAPKILTRPMNVGWTANTDQGYMTGDYIATAFSGGVAHGIFAVAKKINGSVYNEYMATTKAGLPPASGIMRYTSRGERPVPNAHSDRVHWYPPPVEQEAQGEGD